MDTDKWEGKAREAFEHYLADLKVSLPADANFRDIERAMLKFSPEMMRKTAEALVLGEPRTKAFSPEAEGGG